MSLIRQGLPRRGKGSIAFAPRHGRIRTGSRCRELLETTDQPVAQIARRIGFRSGEYLHTVFARAFGMTPRQYRLRG